MGDSPIDDALDTAAEAGAPALITGGLTPDVASPTPDEPAREPVPEVRRRGPALFTEPMWVLGLVILMGEVDKNIVRGMITPIQDEFGASDFEARAAELEPEPSRGLSAAERSLYEEHALLERDHWWFLETKNFISFRWPWSDAVGALRAHLPGLVDGEGRQAQRHRLVRFCLGDLDPVTAEATHVDSPRRLVRPQVQRASGSREPGDRLGEPAAVQIASADEPG